MDNMRIYNESRVVPEEAQKAFNNGKFSGTDINPMWRIKKLTELFGPCGIGWYYDVVSERSESHGDMTMAIVDLNLYVKVDGEWSKPIYGTGGNTLLKTTRSGTSTSDEGYKMALTDALSVACKALGIGADIYFDKDKTKYTATGSKEAAEEAAKQKMEEYKAKDEELAKNPPPRAMATAEQKVFIQQNAPDDLYLKAMQEYGPNFETMGQGEAAKIINHIKRTSGAS